jgi:putative flippase GtrA
MTIFKYSFFAIIAIAVNIVTQFLSYNFLSINYILLISILLGTLTGLLTKYYLDKRFIFYHKPKNKVQNFTLYSITGIFTTMIFWGTEILFYFYFNTQQAKYIGGILGLCVGYFIKYNLDKKYVFI